MSADKFSEHSYVAKSASIHAKAELEHPVHLSARASVHAGSFVGAFTFVNMDSVIFPNVRIGKFCSIARGCEIGVADHPMHLLSSHTFQYNTVLFPSYPGYDFKRSIKHTAHSPTEIGSDVWIGAQCVIRSGVKIGHGAVVGANSVVTKDIEPYAIYVGSPARKIRYRFDESVVEELVNSNWWNLPPEVIFTLPFSELNQCIEMINQYKSSLKEG